MGKGLRSNAPAGGREDRVANSRRHHGYYRFSNPRRALVAGYDLHLNLRRFVNMEHFVAAVKAGLLTHDDPRRFGFHNLRHSLASFLVRTNTDPKTVQALLRHSDVRTTLQLYAHSITSERLAAQGEMLQAILGSVPPANC